MEKYYPIFRGEIQNGLLKIKDRDLFGKYLRRLTGKNVEVMIREEHQNRSNKQNRAYWGVVINQIVQAISNDTGQDEEDVHAYLKTQFLSKKIVVNEDLVTIVGSTTTLSKGEFTKYIERCYDLATLPPEEGGFGLVLSEIGLTNKAGTWQGKNNH